MGLVFGFFYSRNMWFVLSKLPTKNGYLIKLLFLTFLVIVGFWQINGFRFWTATHIFFYATIPYILNQNKKSLWFLPLAILTHFSFILPSLVILAFHFTKNKSKIFFYFFLLSLLFVGINLSVLENYVLSFLPSIFQAKVDVYTNQEYVSEVKNSKESLSTLAVVFRNSLPIYISLLFFVIGTKYFKLVKKDKVLLNLFNFTLLLMGVSNILSIIPSVGRFRTVSFMFALCFLILFLSKKNILYRLKIFAILLTPLLIGYCFGILRLAANKIGNTTFIGNPFFILLERIS